MDHPHAETGALITGGAQGLGRAVAERLIAEGCRRLVLVDLDARKLAATVEELRANGAEVHALPLDMGDIPAVQGMVAEAVARIGPVTALVNGAANTARGSVLDTTPEQWDAIMNPNAKGAFFAMQGFARHCIAAGHPGAVVNILSIVVHGGLPVLAPYVASKAALLGLTKNVAAALLPHRIRVNGINVGWMDTPGEDARQKLSHGRADGWQAEAAASLPFCRMVRPEDVAWQVAFLLGPRSGVVTGSVMDFDQQVVGAYPDTDAH
ncbi:SDR family oxidoreductase [Mesobacterium pallidum]|uniref:SDR family oxidoreductase n=1 Tax=Mesobacterium pallidum TaxID=2872037 RepID=UPI001EE311B6|nr:SDR family oxidoreductase [Mesobacterium pallidum]